MALWDKNEIAKKLNDVFIFKELKNTEILKLAETGEVISISQGSHAVIEGDPGRGLYIVLSGQLAVIKNHQSDKSSARIAQLESGASFGEMSLFDPAPRSATVVADTNCDLFFLDFQIFEKFMNAAEKDMQVRFYKSCALDLAARFRQLNQDFTATQKLLWKEAFKAKLSH